MHPMEPTYDPRPRRDYRQYLLPYKEEHHRTKMLRPRSSTFPGDQHDLLPTAASTTMYLNSRAVPEVVDEGSSSHPVHDFSNTPSTTPSTSTATTSTRSSSSRNNSRNHRSSRAVPPSLKPSDTVSVSDSEPNGVELSLTLDVLERNEVSEEETCCDDTSDEEAQRILQEEYSTLIRALTPPPSRPEIARDAILRYFDHPYVQMVGLLVVFLIIVDGAFFFYLLMGWQGMCSTPSKRDCDPRNWWYNWSIQVLNIFITYMNVASFPWRLTNFLHITGWSWDRRENRDGCNLYGIPNDPDIWFHIPRAKRLGITCFLLLNNIMQFTNHSMRLKYYSYDLQNTWPGNLLTSCFFLTSFTSAGIGGGWMLYEMGQLRTKNPQQFAPGPVDSVKAKWRQFKRGRPAGAALKKDHDSNGGLDDSSEESDIIKTPSLPPQFEDELEDFSAHHNNDDTTGEDPPEDSPTTTTTSQRDIYRLHPDPTRDPLHRAVVGQGTERAGFRMFAI